MGWSDISISLTGPIVNSTILHFTDRWNYIWGQKYNTEENANKYQKLDLALSHAPPSQRLVDQGEGGGEMSFGGLQRHFTRHFGRIWGEEERQEEPREEDHGAHIQMCRR